MLLRPLVLALVGASGCLNPLLCVCVCRDQALQVAAVLGPLALLEVGRSEEETGVAERWRGSPRLPSRT